MAQTVKNLPVMQDTWIQSLGQKDPLEKEWLPTPLFLPREFRGQKSLEGYSPQGHRESDMTERLTLSGYSPRDHRKSDTTERLTLSLHCPSLHGVSRTLSL